MPTKTILVIEDDQTIRQMARAFLGDEGYTVLTADDVGAALDVMREHVIDLILLDHNTGPIEDQEFIRGVRHHSSPRLPIELWTAMPNPAERALALGADGGLAKPIGLDALLDRVRQDIGAP